MERARGEGKPRSLELTPSQGQSVLAVPDLRVGNGDVWIVLGPQPSLERTQRQVLRVPSLSTPSVSV